MAAALALVSCSQDDLMTGIENRPTGAIGAKVFVPTVSRGTALNNEGDLVTAGNGFDLYAFLVDDNSQFMGAAADGNNVGVPFVGSGTEDSYEWNYENESQMRFWSEAGESDIKFFAVSPKNALTEGFLTKTISLDSQTFAYTTPETCSEQVDLMYGVTAEQQYSSTTGEHLENGISLQFRHALSQIVFKAKTESELIYADVTGVKIRNVYQTGSFDVATAETYRTAEDKTAAIFPWKDYADMKDFTAQLGNVTPKNINTQYDENGEATGTTNENGNYQDGRLTDSSEALLLIPQNLESNNAVLAITCSVRYKRGESDEPTIVDNQTIEVPVTTHWQPGYKYTYTLIFTAEMGNPIKVMTVGVDIWNDAGDTDVEVDGNGNTDPWKAATYLTHNNSEILIEDANDLAEARDYINARYLYKFGEGADDKVYYLSDNNGGVEAASDEDYSTGAGEGIPAPEYFHFYEADYLQTGEVNLSTVCGENSSSWVPIGINVDCFFSGRYNGQGNSITNLYINDGENNYIGLFGHVTDAEIKGISASGEIKCTMVNYATYVGGIVGYGERTFISDCTSDVSITGGSNIGGIVGSLKNGGSTVLRCVNKGNLTSGIKAGSQMGGIAGNTYSEPSEGETVNILVACYNLGDVSSGEESNAPTHTGGIVGYNNETSIYACYNTGNIYQTNYNYGGISGCNFGANGTIDSNYWGVECTLDKACNNVNYEGTDPTNCQKVDNSTIQWSTGDESAMSKMNAKILELTSTIPELSGWSYDVNTDEATQTTIPLVLKHTAN